MIKYFLTVCQVEVQVPQDTAETLMVDLDHLAQSPEPVVPPASPAPQPLTPQKMPDFQRRLVMCHDLPSNWIIKRGEKSDFLNIILDSLYYRAGSGTVHQSCRGGVRQHRVRDRENKISEEQPDQQHSKEKKRIHSASKLLCDKKTSVAVSTKEGQVGRR